MKITKNQITGYERQRERTNKKKKQANGLIHQINYTKRKWACLYPQKHGARLGSPTLEKCLGSNSF